MLTFGSRGASFACTDFCYCRAQPLILGDADPPWIVPGIISDDEKKAYLRHTIGAHAAPAQHSYAALARAALGSLGRFRPSDAVGSRLCRAHGALFRTYVFNRTVAPPSGAEANITVTPDLWKKYLLIVGVHSSSDNDPEMGSPPAGGSP